MDQRGDEIHASSTEATGGSREGVVRWVLIIGLVLVVVLLSAIWIGGAATQDDGADSQPSVSRQMQEAQATEDARGEPMMPATQESSSASATATPSASKTPGDAPAGDPTNTAQ
jgi:hypothetical protein